MSNPSELSAIAKAKFVLGYPYLFDNKFYIYPPKVKEVIGNPDYGKLTNVLTLSQEDTEENILRSKYPDFIKDSAQKQVEAVKELMQTKIATPFESLLINVYHNQDYRKIVEDAFLLFTREPITFFLEDKKILVGTLEKDILEWDTADKVMEMKWLTEENYFDFQTIIRAAAGLSVVEPYEAQTHPKIFRMKLLARERERNAAKSKSKKQSLETLLLSICLIGAGITLENIGEQPYVTINRLLELYQQKEGYELEIASMVSSNVKKKKDIEYWIRD